MTKVRDIAAFLGKTESLNTTNKTLAFDSSAVTTITPAVVTTLAGAGGTVVYDSVGLLPASPNDGDRAWVTSNNRFYVADSSWHNSLLINIPPTINIANYDSVLTDSQSLTMTIQVTDSFENPDIISFNAVLSPPNITDSAVLTFSRDSSVIAIAMSPDSTNDATSFTITFSANDQVNLSTSVKSFTIDKGFVLEPLSQIISLSGSTIINADSDLAGGTFSLVSGDIVSDSGGSVTATISDATFLGGTVTNLGTLVAAGAGDQGTGYFGLNQDGTFNNDQIGKVVSLGSSNTTAVSRFRTGNASGGQIISSYTSQSYSSTSASKYNSGSSAFNQNWTCFGFMHSSVTQGGFLYNSKGWSTTLGNALPTNVGLTTNADGSGAVINSQAAVTYRQGRQTITHNAAQLSSSFFTYLAVNITYWNGRYNYMEYTNTSGATYFRCQYDRTSYFTAGALLFGTYGLPTATDVLECNHLIVHSSSYNAGTNETTVYCGNQYLRQINQLKGPGGTTTFSTGAVSPSVNIGFRISTNAQPVHYYKGSATSQGGPMDIRVGDTIAGNYISAVEQITFYSTSSSTVNYYKVATTPSPAGDGTNIALGTGNAGTGMYAWPNETKITVDDNTGLTAGKILQKKT